jgi:hypothetical protein
MTFFQGFKAKLLNGAFTFFSRGTDFYAIHVRFKT